MLCLTVSELSLSYGTAPVLEKVSFSADETDRIGVIGVNGCGKSTLFRLIHGDLEPTAGYIYLSKGKTVGILRQGGYIHVAEDGGITLTESGQAVAEKIYERHRLLTSFLVKLGVDEKTAAEDACKMEHVISDASMEAIKRHAAGRIK